MAKNRDLDYFYYLIITKNKLDVIARKSYFGYLIIVFNLSSKILYISKFIFILILSIYILIFINTYIIRYI